MTSLIIEHYIFCHIPEFEYALNKRDGKILNHRIVLQQSDFFYSVSTVSIEKIKDLKTLKKFTYKFHEFKYLFYQLCFEPNLLPFKKWLWKHIKLTDVGAYHLETMKTDYTRCQTAEDLDFHLNQVVKITEFPDLDEKLNNPPCNFNILKYFYDRKLIDLNVVSKWLQKFKEMDIIFDVIDFICEICTKKEIGKYMLLLLDNQLFIPSSMIYVYALQRSNFICKYEIFENIIKNQHALAVKVIGQRLGKFPLPNLDHEFIYMSGEDMLKNLEIYCHINLYDYVDENKIIASNRPLNYYFHSRTSHHPAWSSIIKNENFIGFFGIKR